MQKLILLFCCGYLFTSCASTAPSLWTINGNVTAYNQDGSILRQWDNVIIESGFTDTWVGTQTTSNAIKTFGFNFTDPKTQQNIIVSNAVPCIIEYSNKKYDTSKEPESPILHNNDIIKLFKSGEIFSYDEEHRITLENNAISEIKSDINSAQTKQDIITLKEKIDILSTYNKSMEKRGSYYDIQNELIAINLQFNRKARKLGVKLE